MRDSLDRLLQDVTPLVIWQRWLWPASFLIVGLVSGLVVEKIVVSTVRKVFRHQSIQLNDYIVSLLKGMVWCLFLLWGLSLATYSMPLDARSLGVVRSIIFMVGMILIIRLLAQVAVAVVRFYLNHAWALKALPNTSIFENIIRIAVYGFGLIIMLQTMGVSVWPLITALGAGGLAVSLALQDTLANMFAGIQMILARQIRVGDTIQLENGLSGRVEDIGWRTTMLRQLSGNRVILPNNKMAANIIVNYTLPHPDLTVTFPVEVPIIENPRKMEEWVTAALREAAAGMLSGQSAVSTTPDPIVRFVAYGDASMQMSVSMTFATPVDGGLLRHEFFKTLHDRFATEQVSPPFPRKRMLLDFPEERWERFHPLHVEAVDNADGKGSEV